MSSPISPVSPVLSNVTTSATNLGNLALVIPNQVTGYQPQNPLNADGTPSKLIQPPSFLFDYEGEQTAELTSDITDHYVEDNTAVQDQIALQPVRITTKGFVSELNNVLPASLQFLKNITSGLSVVQTYAPAISVSAQLAYNQAFQAYQIATNLANSAVSAWSSITNVTSPALTGNEGFQPISPFGLGNRFFPINGAQSKQQVAFQLFYGYWIHRILFTVQTPWAIFKNMAIEKIRPIQTEDTITFSTFECTFKQIRTAQSAVLSQSAISDGRLVNQSSSLTNQGISTPPSDVSLESILPFGSTGPLPGLGG